MGDLRSSGEFVQHANKVKVNLSLFQVAAMSSKSGSGSKRKAIVGEGGGKREGRREKEKTGRSGRESRGEGSIDRPSVFSRLGTKMGGANRGGGAASNSSGAPAWSNRGSLERGAVRIFDG